MAHWSINYSAPPYMAREYARQCRVMLENDLRELQGKLTNLRSRTQLRILPYDAMFNHREAEKWNRSTDRDSFSFIQEDVQTLIHRMLQHAREVETNPQPQQQHHAQDNVTRRPVQQAPSHQGTGSIQGGIAMGGPTAPSGSSQRQPATPVYTSFKRTSARKESFWKEADEMAAKFKKRDNRTPVVTSTPKPQGATGNFPVKFPVNPPPAKPVKPLQVHRGVAPPPPGGWGGFSRTDAKPKTKTPPMAEARQQPFPGDQIDPPSAATLARYARNAGPRPNLTDSSASEDETQPDPPPRHVSRNNIPCIDLSSSEEGETDKKSTERRKRSPIRAPTESSGQPNPKRRRQSIHRSKTVAASDSLVREGLEQCYLICFNIL